MECKKNDVCKPEACKKDEICYAHVKRSNSGWTHQKAECKKEKSCKDSPYKCDKTNKNCHVCCSTKNCNSITQVAATLKNLDALRRKRRDAGTPKLKLSRDATFIPSNMVETRVVTYPLTLLDAFQTKFSGSAGFAWVGTLPSCKGMFTLRPLYSYFTFTVGFKMTGNPSENFFKKIHIHSFICIITFC